ncbi:hypothetical protein BDR26DRAFT_919341, partial [Obelidium mucronatum]
MYLFRQLIRPQQQTPTRFPLLLTQSASFVSPILRKNPHLFKNINKKPEPPQKPPTAMTLWKRQQLKDKTFPKNPNKTLKDWEDEWYEAPDDVREKFTLMARALKKEHKEKVSIYQAARILEGVVLDEEGRRKVSESLENRSTPSDVLNATTALEADPAQNTKSKNTATTTAESSKHEKSPPPSERIPPLKGLTAFQLYLKSKNATEHLANQDPVKYMREMILEWTKLPKIKRQPYVEEEKRQKNAFSVAQQKYLLGDKAPGSGRSKKAVRKEMKANLLAKRARALANQAQRKAKASMTPSPTTPATRTTRNLTSESTKP